MISFGDALDLDVHLQGRDTVGGTRHLEVHVAQVIFVTQDVGQHGEAVASLIRPMAIPATCAFMGTPASISDRQPPQTRSHRRGAVGSVISDTTRMV